MRYENFSPFCVKLHAIVSPLERHFNMTSALFASSISLLVFTTAATAAQLAPHRAFYTLQASRVDEWQIGL
jgi:hypothetical protein